MSKQNVPNSTERLLNRIRDNKSQIGPIQNNVKYAEQSIPIKKILKNSLSAGVTIDDENIYLALTGENKQTHQKELLKWTRVPFTEGLHIDSKRFPPFLRNTLDHFLGKYKNVKIWAAIKTKDLRHKNIIVPDLPDSKIANAVLWGLKKEYEISSEDEIFDFEIIDDIVVDGIKKRNVSAFTGKRDSIQKLKRLFSQAGYRLTGITALPFAFQNYFIEDIMQSEGSPFVLVNVSREHSDIFCYSDATLLLVRNIRSGSYSLAEDMIESGPMDDNKVIDHLSMAFDMDSPEFQNIKPASERLVSKIVRTGDYCSNNVASNRPVEQYLIYGETDNCRAFLDFAKVNIPSQVDVFSPLEIMTGHSIGIHPPSNAMDRNGIIQATALALSSNETTANFLYTYNDKANEARAKKINLSITAAGFLLLIGCLAGWYGFDKSLKSAHAEVKKLDREIAQYQPTATQKSLSEKMNEVQDKINQIEKYATDYKSLAVIHEIISLAPDNIYIEQFEAGFIERIYQDKRKKPSPPAARLSGNVKAPNTALEPTLTDFILQLEDSPFFQSVLIVDKMVENEKSPDILNFTITMEVN